MAAGSSKLPRLPFQLNWAFKLSVMDRYIATELIAPFLFGVGAFSSLGVSVGALFELIRRVTDSGLPLVDRLQSAVAAISPVHRLFVSHLDADGEFDDLQPPIE